MTWRKSISCRKRGGKVKTCCHPFLTSSLHCQASVAVHGVEGALCQYTTFRLHRASVLGRSGCCSHAWLHHESLEQCFVERQRLNGYFNLQLLELLSSLISWKKSQLYLSCLLSWNSLNISRWYPFAVCVNRLSSIVTETWKKITLNENRVYLAHVIKILVHDYLCPSSLRASGELHHHGRGAHGTQGCYSLAAS